MSDQALSTAEGKLHSAAGTLIKKKKNDQEPLFGFRLVYGWP